MTTTKLTSADRHSDRAETSPDEKLVQTKSDKLFERAQKFIPGGVNSPVRSCKAVGATPLFISKADGSTIWDVDNNSFIDYCGSWGAHVLGHRYPRVQEAIEEALVRGTSFGAPTALEVELAETICKLVPSIEMVRMVNSGTEATMSAIRLARAFTQRTMVLKFDGCYHGHADSFLVKAGSGLATLGISSSPGVPEDLTKLTLSLPFNDLPAVEKAFKEHKDKIAAIIVEPIMANAGLIMPDDNYLAGLKELATKNGALLIFDEVITGFRVALGGAQGKYGVKPDLTCLGKIIGGGLPVGAYGGRRDIMEMVAPLGSVYQAGTLSGNPLAMAAGLAQLRALQYVDPYAYMTEQTKRLADGFTEIAKKSKVACQVVHTTGLLCVFFGKTEIQDFATAQKADSDKFASFWKVMLHKGIYWPPSQFETAFISGVHSKPEIDATLSAFEEAIR